MNCINALLLLTIQLLLLVWFVATVPLVGAVVYSWYTSIGSVYDVWNMVLRDELRIAMVHTFPGLADIYGITAPTVTTSSLFGSMATALWVSFVYGISRGVGFLCALVTACSLPVVVLAAVLGALRRAFQSAPTVRPATPPPVPLPAGNNIAPGPINPGALPAAPAMGLPPPHAEPVLAALVGDLAQFDAGVDAAVTAALHSNPDADLLHRSFGVNTPASGCNGECRTSVVRATNDSTKAFLVRHTQDGTTIWEPVPAVVRVPATRAPAAAKGKKVKPLLPSGPVQSLPVRPSPLKFAANPPNVANIPTIAPANYYPVNMAGFQRPDMVSSAPAQYPYVSPYGQVLWSYDGRPNLQSAASQYARSSQPKVNPAPTSRPGPVPPVHPGPSVLPNLAPPQAPLGTGHSSASPQSAVSTVGYRGDPDHATGDGGSPRHSGPPQPPVNTAVASESGDECTEYVLPPPPRTVGPQEPALTGRQNDNPSPGSRSTTTELGVYKHGGLRTGPDPRERESGSEIRPFINPPRDYSFPPPPGRVPTDTFAASYPSGL